MLYELFQWLEANFDFPGAGLWNFISFRAGMGALFSLIISMLFGGRIIRFLRTLQIGEDIRDLGLEGQLEKRNAYNGRRHHHHGNCYSCVTGGQPSKYIYPGDAPGNDLDGNHRIYR